jgi:hypothetical protein
MSTDISDLTRRLAQNAEAVCRHYLSNGRREGRYWLVGDVHNTPGRSLFVRLSGSTSSKGTAGRWQDAATGQHGDLLDIIRERCGLSEFRDVAEEARRFLGLAHDKDRLVSGSAAIRIADRDRDRVQDQNRARRLFAKAQPLPGTLAETYLHRRGIVDLQEASALRFHPRCFYRAAPDAPRETWPALIAAVTDLNGVITGVHRTWLDPDGFDPIRLGKAPVTTPRRALGHLLGHAVRFGVPSDTMAVGEGIETILSLRFVLPTVPMAAALSAGHLTAILLPAGLRRLYLTRDTDHAGDAAVAQLTERAHAAGIEAITLSPRLGDFNDDLREHGLDELRARLRGQIVPEDVVRFMASGSGTA